MPQYLDRQRDADFGLITNQVCTVPLVFILIVCRHFVHICIKEDLPRKSIDLVCQATCRSRIELRRPGKDTPLKSEPMMTKREELQKFCRGEGCLYKVDEDEPVFVLRGQDKFYVPLVRLWIELVEMATQNPPSAATAAKLMDAVENANYAIDWQNAHPDRVKVPD
jgi:hypothetical protein